MTIDLNTALITAMQAWADGAGDLDVRAAFGTPGHRILVRDEVQDTGQAWSDPSFMKGVFAAVSSVMGAWAEESFTLIGSETAVTLAKQPRSSTLLFVARNGVYMMPASTPTLAYEFSWNGAKEISFLPLAGKIRTVYFY